MEAFTNFISMAIVLAVFLLGAGAAAWFWLLRILEEDSKRALWQQEQLRHPMIHGGKDAPHPTIEPLSDAAVNGKGR